MRYWLSFLSVSFSIVFISISLLLPDKYAGIQTIGAPLLSMIPMVLAFQAYSLIKKRMSKETRSWLFLFVASIINFTLNILISVRGIFGLHNTNFFPNSFSVLSIVLYFFLFGGLYQTSRIFTSERKVDLRLPFAVVTLIFIGGSVFLIFFMKLHEVLFLRQLSFLLYLLFDMSLILVSWAVTLRTWGGLFSIPYRLIASSAILFSVYHFTVLINQISNISYSEQFNIAEIIYIITQSILCFGLDIRVQIEKSMENLAKK